MKIMDFDYQLPKELIAQSCADPKDSSKLMVIDKNIHHKYFYEIIDYMDKDDVLVINETKVKKAKINAKKSHGGKAEITLTRKINDKEYECMIKSHRVRKGEILLLDNGLKAEVVEIYKFYILRFDKKINDKDFFLPGPPYVKKNVTEKEYQTVYAKKEGSLAAPTAGLHFTSELIEKIKQKGVKIAKLCLHIDYGTFLPIKGKITNHKMHSEEYEVSKICAEKINKRKGKLIVMGTTSVRTLESCADRNGKIIPKKGKTSIFIYPGYKFKTNIDILVTNFHLPKSTLLILVSTYFGREKILDAYEEAVKKRYRFFSLGDSMMLIKE